MMRERRLIVRGRHALYLAAQQGLPYSGLDWFFPWRIRHNMITILDLLILNAKGGP